MNLLRFLVAIDGIAQLWAPDGTFLGLLSSDPYDPNALINPHTYGNPDSLTSIRNSASAYGALWGKHSPYNPVCDLPPVILYQGRAVLVVTQNSDLSNGLPMIAPDLMLGVYTRQTNRLTDLATLLRQSYTQKQRLNTQLRPCV